MSLRGNVVSRDRENQWCWDIRESWNSLVTDGTRKGSFEEHPCNSSSGRGMLACVQIRQRHPPCDTCSHASTRRTPAFFSRIQHFWELCLKTNLMAQTCPKMSLCVLEAWQIKIATPSLLSKYVIALYFWLQVWPLHLIQKICKFKKSYVWLI